MLEQYPNDKILFLDIETVPQVPEYYDLPKKDQEFWDEKARKSELRKDPEKQPDEVYGRAGIYSEFGKVVCISAGYFAGDIFRLKSFYSDDETQLLKDFGDMLDKFCQTKKDANLCAHNGKEFDFPYIARRMLINGVKIPSVLDVAGKKPWEVQFIDTMELWKFGDYKHYTSLNLLTHIFNIPTPKDDIDGSQVASVYWEDKDLERIVRYCEKDVLAVAQLFLRFKGQDLIKEENVESVTWFG